MVGGSYAGFSVDVAALDLHAQHDRFDGPAGLGDLLPAAVGEGRDGKAAVGEPVGEAVADQPYERIAHDGQAHALFHGEVVRLDGLTGERSPRMIASCRCAYTCSESICFPGDNSFPVPTHAEVCVSSDEHTSSPGMDSTMTAWRGMGCGLVGER